MCEGTQPVRDAWHHVESPDYSVLLEQRRRPNAMPELVKLWLVRGASDVVRDFIKPCLVSIVTYWQLIDAHPNRI